MGREPFRCALLVALAVGACGVRSRAVPDYQSDAGAGDPCAKDPMGEGCPCVVGGYACWTGTDETRGVGACHDGAQQCPAGILGPCEGQGLPSAETCNGQDDDCDGDVSDEGCDRACVGVGCDDDFPAGEGTRQGPGGGVTLATPRDAPAVLWVPEVYSGTVAKVDTRTREVVARYQVVPGDGCRDTPESVAGSAVDPDGNFYLSTRQEVMDVGVSRIASIQYAGCPDRDGDGVVETSLGPDDVRPWGEDECVRWSVEQSDDPVSGVPLAYERVARGTGPGALLWAGHSRTGRLWAIDPETGEETGDETNLPLGGWGSTPDSLTFDAQGVLFASSGADQTTYVVDTGDLSADSVEAPIQWRGSVGRQDHEGHVWFSGALQSYDPDLDEWAYPRDYLFGSHLSFLNFVVAPTGVVWGELDGGGTYPVATYDIPKDVLEALDEDRMGVSLALDRDGFVWEVQGAWEPSCSDARCCEEAETPGSAWVRDPWTGERSLAIDSDLWLSFFFGDATGVVPLDTLTPPRPVVVSLEACEGARWIRLDWAAEIPDQTSIAFEVESSDAPSPSGAWTFLTRAPPASSPATLSDLEPGRHLHVRATLTADLEAHPADRVAPELLSIGAEYDCP